MSNLRVKDIMTKRPMTVSPDDTVVFAASLLSKHNFNGLPVVNDNGILMGIITEYDLISQGNSLHLPVLIDILGNIASYKKDGRAIKDALKNLLGLKVKDIMNSDPLTVEEDAWIQETVDLFAHHHRVNPIPVTNSARKLVGIISRFDLVKLLADDKSNQNPDIFVKNFEKKVFSNREKTGQLWPVIFLSLGLVGLILALALFVFYF